MNVDFIKTQLQEATYRLKKGTTTSYYWQEGSKILPNRICFSDAELSKVKKSGRNNLHPIVGQILANFTQKEESPLKLVKPFQVRTQIWQFEEYPQYTGYGTLGITTTEGVKDTGDLIIVSKNEDSLKIYFFTGMSTPDEMQKAFSFLTNQNSI